MSKPPGHNTDKQAKHSRRSADTDIRSRDDSTVRVRVMYRAQDLYQLAQELSAGVVPVESLRKRASGIVFEIVTGQRCSAAHACNPTTTGEPN